MERRLSAPIKYVPKTSTISQIFFEIGLDIIEKRRNITNMQYTPQGRNQP